MGRLHVFDILSSFTRTESNSASITNMRSLKHQHLATFPALSSMFSTSCFGLLWRDSPQWVSCQRYVYSTFHSIGQKSSSPLSNLTASRTCRSNEDNLPSIHRPTSSSQSSRLSQMSCFKADKSIAKRLLSTCLVLGDTNSAKRLSQSVIQTCHIAAGSVSFH